MDTELVLWVPVGLGTLITVLVGLGKMLGWVPEDTGGKVSLALNVVVGAILYLAAGVFEVDIEGDTAQMVYQLLGLLAAILAGFLSSMVSQKASKAATLYTPRGNRR